MSYCITKNAMAPKCTADDGYNINLENNSHMIMWYRCNFRCAFCEFASYDFKNYQHTFDLTEDEFIGTIIQLLPYGKNFKFSGGEPTLNPNVERDLKIVKDFGGTVFFDTNGSNPELVKDLLEKGLIDVLAVSFKGLTAEECLSVSCVKKKELCWDNVFKTIEYGSQYENVKVIVTHVCYNDCTIDELLKFSSLLEPYKDVYYKINNLNGDRYRDPTLKKIDSDLLLGLLKQLLEIKPMWKGRIIYIKDKSAVSGYDNIIFM